MPKTQKITTFLWFDNQAEEAAKYYVSIFKDSRIVGTTRYDDESSRAAGRPKGSVMTVEFELDGQRFTALNGGPLFKFTEAIAGRALREPEGGRPLLGEAHGRWRGSAVRLAQGSLWPFVAGRTRRHAGDAAVEGSREIQARRGGDADDEEARHRRLDEGVRGTLGRGRVEPGGDAVSVRGGSRRARCAATSPG